MEEHPKKSEPKRTETTQVHRPASSTREKEISICVREEPSHHTKDTVVSRFEEEPGSSSSRKHGTSHSQRRGSGSHQKNGPPAQTHSTQKKSHHSRHVKETTEVHASRKHESQKSHHSRHGHESKVPSHTVEPPLQRQESPLRTEPLQKHSAQRQESPEKSHSARREESPLRTEPLQKHSTQRQESPEKSHSPQREPSPLRTEPLPKHSSHRNESPEKSLCPQIEQSPLRTEPLQKHESPNEANKHSRSESPVGDTSADNHDSLPVRHPSILKQNTEPPAPVHKPRHDPYCDCAPPTTTKKQYSIARPVTPPPRAETDFRPIWYQQAGSKSSEWMDGGTHYVNMHNPADQVGAFPPKVKMEEMVKAEKKKRRIKDILPYSTGAINKTTTKKDKKTGTSSMTSQGHHVPNEYAVHMFEARNPIRWNLDYPDTGPSYQIKSTPIFNTKQKEHDPFNYLEDIYSYAHKTKPHTESSTFNIASVSSGTGTSAFRTHVYNMENRFDMPCNCAIPDCNCMFEPCSSRDMRRKAKAGGEMPCVTPSQLTACTRGRTNSTGPELGRSGVFVTREPDAGVGDLGRGCDCTTQYCQCIYNPCASRKRQKRRVKKKVTKKRFKLKKHKTAKKEPECRIKACEVVVNCCMRMCCMTWIWNEQEFMRHIRRRQGPLPEYAEKPPSLHESALQRWWNSRYNDIDELDDLDEIEGENAIACYCPRNSCPDKDEAHKD